MQEKAKDRLRELAPTARGSQEAVFTQPSLHIFLHVFRRTLVQIIAIGTTSNPWTLQARTAYCSTKITFVLKY